MENGSIHVWYILPVPIGSMYGMPIHEGLIFMEISLSHGKQTLMILMCDQREQKMQKPYPYLL